MTESASNVHMQYTGFTEKDVQRAIHQLAYRKAYNNSAKAKQARKERYEKLQKVMEYVRQHPEVVL